MGLKSGMKHEDVMPEKWENDGWLLFIAPFKSKKRSMEKVEGDYDGDWLQLRNIVRGAICVSVMAQIKQAIETCIQRV